MIPWHFSSYYRIEYRIKASPQRKLARYKNGGERKRITKENTKITEGKILQIPKFLRNMWQLKQKKNK